LDEQRFADAENVINASGDPEENHVQIDALTTDLLRAAFAGEDISLWRQRWEALNAKVDTRWYS
jgi:hypothetical protein